MKRNERNAWDCKNLIFADIANVKNKSEEASLLKIMLWFDFNSQSVALWLCF